MAESEATGNDRTPRRISGGQAVSLVLTLLLAVLLGMRAILSPDVGFHLATARYILDTGWVPSTDIFTYTVPDHAYVDLQWLFQLIVYAAHAMAGAVGIITLCTALTIVVAVVLVLRARQVEPRVGFAVLPLLIPFLLGNQCEMRPHLFSWLFMALIMICVELHQRGSRKGLWFLPLIMLIWVNTHSLFVLGLVILGSYVAANVLLSLTKRQKFDRSLIIWTVVASMACLMNPYGISGVMFPFEQFAMIQSATIFNSPTMGIKEFQSPLTFQMYGEGTSFKLFQDSFYWHVYICMVALGLAGRWLKLRVVDLILLIAFGYLFARANKNFGYFVMATFPMAETTSIPSVTLPKIACFPSSHAVGARVMKNCEPPVFGPACAIDSVPLASCLRLACSSQSVQ